MPTFLVDYTWRDGVYSVDLWAEDFDDARARLENLKANGRVIGQLEMRIPAVAPVPVMRRIADVICWWKNRKPR